MAIKVLKNKFIVHFSLENILKTYHNDVIE